MSLPPPSSIMPLSADLDMFNSPFFKEDMSIPIATHFFLISFESGDWESDSMTMVPETPLSGGESKKLSPFTIEEASALTESEPMAPNFDFEFIPFDEANAELHWNAIVVGPWMPYEWTKERGRDYLGLLGLWLTLL